LSVLKKINEAALLKRPLFVNNNLERSGIISKRLFEILHDYTAKLDCWKGFFSTFVVMSGTYVVLRGHQTDVAFSIPTRGEDQLKCFIIKGNWKEQKHCLSVDLNRSLKKASTNCL
jgi:hypothetical protein